jgi:hypothetical protein
VGAAAPRAFNEFLELPIGLLACILLSLWLLYGFRTARVMRIAFVCVAGAIAALVTRTHNVERSVNIRNFYGTLRVSDTGAADTMIRALYNGTIKHGAQYLAPERSRIPTTYYGDASGLAIALSALRKGEPVRAGMIGLGVGTFATYARSGDVFRFYEINPDVIRLAEVEFRYLRESRGKVELAGGDARLSLEREPPQNYDLLAVDAFSGDSIPVHLITREAFALYFRHLKPGGALAIHVTNRHLDLAPVVKAIADTYGARSLLIHNSDEDARHIYESSWVIVTHNAGLADDLDLYESAIDGKPVLWTDDYSNLLSVLR